MYSAQEADLLKSGHNMADMGIGAGLSFYEPSHAADYQTEARIGLTLKRKKRLNNLVSLPDRPPSIPPPAPPASTCGICGEDFRNVSNPVRAALSASSSSKNMELGLSLGCPASHEYCLSCMTSYLRAKLEGGPSDHSVVFPIRCPECPRDVPWEMDDLTAGKVLGEDLLEVWHFQRLKSSLPTVSCRRVFYAHGLDHSTEVFDAP